MYFILFYFGGLVKAGHFDPGGHGVFTECENNRRVNVKTTGGLMSCYCFFISSTSLCVDAATLLNLVVIAVIFFSGVELRPCIICFDDSCMCIYFLIAPSVVLLFRSI